MKKLLTILFLLPLLAGAQTYTNAVIPLSTASFHANDRIAPMDMLFDGDLNVANAYVPCYSDHVDSLRFVCNFDDYSYVSVKKIRIFDGQGNNTYPTQYWLRDKTTGIITQKGTFDGSSYNQWDSIVISSPVQNSQLIIIGGTGANYGVEMQVIGDYTTSPATVFKQRGTVPLKNFFGVNAYYWNYEQDDYNNPGDASRVIERKFQRIKNSFGLVRIFSDWVQWEPHRKQYALSPLRDGWMPDSLLKRNYDNGITTLLCLQGNTAYIKASYVSPGYGDSTDWGPFHDYDPIMKVNYAQRENPASYLELAQMGWQIAARYGRNHNIDTTLITLWNSAADGKGYYTPQSRKVGLGWLSHICPINENDKFWKGDSAYLWGRALAALYSAFYDGDQGRLGPGVGVKTADSTMKVMFAALAVASTDQLRGAIDWWNEHRSGKPACDGIDYHKYSTDASDQYGNVHTGTPVEMSDALTAAKNFVYTADRYLQGMPVWISEHGYDTSQTSPVKAHPVGSLNKLQVQGAWLVRSAFEYASLRMQGAVVFQLFDDSQNPAAFSTQYETSGLLNQDSLYTKRPAADYFQQVISRFGNYYYTSRRCSYPRVDEYTSPPDSNMYYIAVPDSVGGSVSYKLAVPAGVTVTIRQLQEGQDNPTVSTQAESGGFVTVTATEMPQFITVPTTRRYYAQQFSGTIKLGR